ncbi:MAG: T9SS C-terminal target domain-containing protein [Endomicrobiia bacterium]
MNKNTFLIFFIFLLVSNCIFAQKIEIGFKTFLDYSVSETSGLLFINNTFWTHNDSGDKPFLYQIDTANGKILTTKEIVNAKNVDWEDICKSDSHIYIGDIGNNNGTRNIFQIYFFETEKLLGNDNRIMAQKIEFYYDSTFYVPFTSSQKRKTNFDCESLIYFNDSLYLFTKNWGNKKTYLFSIPAKEGLHKAEFIDSLDVDALICGADISEDKSTIALIGYKFGVPANSVLVLLSDFNSDNFFSGKIEYFSLKKLKAHQTEGICFVTRDILLISNEEFYGNKPSLREINISMTLTRNLETSNSYLKRPGFLFIRIKNPKRYNLNMYNAKNEKL